MAEMRPSPSYGVRTRYLRTTVTAWMESGVVLDAVSGPGVPDLADIAHQEEGNRFGAKLGSCRSRLKAPSNAGLARSRAIDILTQTKSLMVFATPTDPDIDKKVYVWLRRSQFELLSGEHMKRILQIW